MRPALKITAGLLAVCTCAMLARPAQAQTTANGPYYATPSWDQTLPANTRFIVLSNMNSAAVLDRETGLVWEKSRARSSAIPGTRPSFAASRRLRAIAGGGSCPRFRS